MAKPGGLVIVTNVAESNPRKAWMEYLMEWNLIYRDEAEMQDLVPSDVAVKRTSIKADSTGVNLFLEIELADG
jgi:extracellular factor (EF) 3-hydroxypalmitic acid methyl ester biosynthesis protein